MESKAVEAIPAAHEAQPLTYLRLCGYRTGLLLNFHALRLKEGLRRFVI